MSIEAPIQMETVPIASSASVEEVTTGAIASPVVVTTSFQLVPGFEEEWLASWRAIGRLALSRPECQGLRLMRDRTDPTYCLMQSEWDSASAFNAFARDARLVWMDRWTEHAATPMRFAYYEVVPLVAAPEPLEMGAD